MHSLTLQGPWVNHDHLKCTLTAQHCPHFISEHSLGDSTKQCTYLNVLKLAIQAAHHHPGSAVVAAELHPAVVLLLVHVLLLGNLDAPLHVPLVAGPADSHTGKAGVICCPGDAGNGSSMTLTAQHNVIKLTVVLQQDVYVYAMCTCMCSLSCVQP